jgi:succinyl-CoA synthetase alpha subunit
MAHAAEVNAVVVGPNTPGAITPGKSKLGIMPAHVFVPGNVGVVSRSGTLTYEVAFGLTRKGFGQSTCLGIGGDPVVGFSFVEALELFRCDSQTEAVVLIGEIGGNLEEVTAEYVDRTGFPKPVVAYVAGRFAVPGKRMGHAGAIIMGKAGSAQSKIEAFEKVGVRVAEKPSDVAVLVATALKR